EQADDAPHFREIFRDDGHAENFDRREEVAVGERVRRETASVGGGGGVGARDSRAGGKGVEVGEGGWFAGAGGGGGPDRFARPDPKAHVAEGQLSGRVAIRKAVDFQNGNVSVGQRAKGPVV